MSGERLGGGLGDSLGLSLKYFAQKVTTDLILAQGVQIAPADKAVLREAALQLREVAARPEQKEKERLWYKHNALQAPRPMVLCDPENGWYEIITPNQLRCRGDLARVVEFQLRKEIFWGRQMGDDRVVTNIYRCHHVFTETSRGLEKQDHRAGNNGAYTWDPPVKTMADVEKLKFSTFNIHWDLTRQFHEACQDWFGDILDVRLETSWWNSTGMTSDLIFLLGMENMFVAMVEEPEIIHALMAFFRDEFLAKFAFVEENGLACNNNNDLYVGTGGYGFSQELKTGNPPGLKDLWGLSESQETTNISPTMFAEFILPYQLPLMERFGLNCYGCCEPLDMRWQYVKEIPRLRRVSVSAWANDSMLAEAMGNRYIFSKKPHSAWLAQPNADEETMRKGLAETLKVARGCNLELIMKDNHTIGQNPENCLKYVRICRELIG